MGVVFHEMIKTFESNISNIKTKYATRQSGGLLLFIMNVCTKV